MLSLLSSVASFFIAKQKAMYEMAVIAFKFVVDNIKWIAPLALCVLVALFVRGVMIDRDQAIKRAKTAENALTTYKQEVQHEAELQQAKIAQMREEGKRNVAKIEANHIKDIQHIAKQYGKVIQDDKNAINDYRTELANRVRNTVAKDGISGMPKDDANRPAETDCNATIDRYNTLKEASKICTEDYNACYRYVKKEQGRLGVYTDQELKN